MEIWDIWESYHEFIFIQVFQWVTSLNTQYSINTEIMVNAAIPVLHFSSFLTVPELVKSVNFKEESGKNGWMVDEKGITSIRFHWSQ